MDASIRTNRDISAAGWYVGAICKDPDCDGMIVPFDRYTDYMTQENAQKCLDTSIEQGVSQYEEKVESISFTPK